MRYYTVCLCWEYEKCKETTERLARKNNAVDYIIESVCVNHIPVIGYRGRIIIKEA